MKNSKLHKVILCFGLLLVTSATVTAQNKRSHWTAFTQHVAVKATKELKFTLLAKVKADVIKRKGKAGLWTRVDNKDGTTGFFENMSNKPIRKNTEDIYMIEGVIDQNAKELFFGGLAWGNGTFTYDDFELYIENPVTQKMEGVPIANGSFEKTSNNRIDGWNIALEEGADENGDGFAVSVVNKETSNSNAVQIVGQGK